VLAVGIAVFDVVPAAYTVPKYGGAAHLNVLLMAFMLGLLGLLSSATWLGFGTGLKRVLSSPRGASGQPSLGPASRRVTVACRAGCLALAPAAGARTLVVRFWIISVVLALIGLATPNLR
jgi:hypothetical protein